MSLKKTLKRKINTIMKNIKANFFSATTVLTENLLLSCITIFNIKQEKFESTLLLAYKMPVYPKFR